MRTGFGTRVCPVINNVTSAPRTALVKRRITQMRFTQILLPSAGWTEFEHTRCVSPDAFAKMKDTTYVIESRMDRVACCERTNAISVAATDRTSSGNDRI